ncbi:MAG TPA: polysaccharide deacetylase family protein [Candidatus Acidoferrum sp.]|nr:polysaccharide deacetylase family protein [Candidatus Acidoferrum sp.]
MLRLSLLLLALLVACRIAVAQPVENQAVILQYHHVSTTTPRSTSVTPDEFRDHMQFLHDNGFTVLPLPEIVQALKTGKQLPNKTIAITFDDAYISIYTTAFPLLQQYHWPFTIFVASGLVGRNPKLYLNWDQLREMGKAGVTLANHSVNHPYMLVLKPGETHAEWLSRVEHEIVDAEQKILQETGQSHHLHAYPYGEYNQEIASLLVRLGYVGFGQHSGAISASSDFTALPRFPFSGSFATLKSFSQKASSLAFNVRIKAPLDPVISEPGTSALLDFDGNYRFDKLVCVFNDQVLKISVEDSAQQIYRITNPSLQNTRRPRYVCTAPGHDGRYYWFTVPFFNPALPDG